MVIMGGLKIKVHFLIKVDFLKYRFKKSSAKNIKGLIKKKCERKILIFITKNLTQRSKNMLAILKSCP